MIRQIIDQSTFSLICLKFIKKWIYQQLYEHFKWSLSPKQCEFGKGNSAQHCLMFMLEKFKESRDKGE